jgi:type IV secretory pathway VirB10-like protein
VNPFLRQRPDGSFALGYSVYLLVGLAVSFGIVAMHHGLASGDGATAPSRRKKSSNVAPITQPAALMSRVEIKNKPSPPETRSYRLENTPAAPPPSPPSSSSAFDAIDAALQAAPSTAAPESNSEDPIRPLDENSAGLRRTTTSTYAELPPSLTAESARAGASAGAPQLLGYRDAAADGSASGPPSDPAGAEPEMADAVVPRGTLIYAYLLTTVDTSNPTAVLQFGAAQNLMFHHRSQLPFGTRFLGKLAGPPARDRLNLAIDTILFPEGIELPVSATAIEADERGGNLRPGVAADYFPPPAWAQLAPYASDFATGYLGLLESRAQRQFAAGLGGAVIPTAASDGAAQPFYQASAQAIQDFTQARLKEISQRYASYYLIPAGTACWLELEADLDLHAARTGQSVHPSFPLRR